MVLLFCNQRSHLCFVLILERKPVPSTDNILNDVHLLCTRHQIHATGSISQNFNMRCIAIIIVAFATASSAFRAFPVVSVRSARLYNTPSTKTDLVPLEKTNIQNAAAATGGIVGFAIGGPILGLILAALSNYVSKKEDSDLGVALRGFGKTVIESYNFLTTLNNKYDATGAATDSLDKFITSAEVESEGFGKFTKTVDSIGAKVVEINTEYDILAKGKQLVIIASTISDAALEKLEALNAKVRLQSVTSSP